MGRNNVCVSVIICKLCDTEPTPLSPSTPTAMAYIIKSKLAFIPAATCNEN